MFLDVKDNETSKTISFCSESLIELMINAEWLLMDGAFKSCPSLLKQIYIVHGYYLKEYLPLAFILMSKRNAPFYGMIFRKIKLISLTLDAIIRVVMQLRFFLRVSACRARFYFSLKNFRVSVRAACNLDFF